MVLESWLIFALAAAVFWSLANVLDKTVLQGFIQNPIVVTFLTGIFGALFSLFLIPFGYVAIPSPSILLLSLLIGVVYVAPIYLYMKSLTLEEVSRVVPIFSLTPVFVTILGALFLGEIFTLGKYAGIALAITGSIMVSSKKFGKEFFHLKANRAFWLIFSGTVIFAVYTVAVRWILSYADFWNIFFWTRIGGLIPVLLLLIHTSTREKIVSTLAAARESRMEFMALSELMNVAAVLFQTLALSLGPAALVETATSAQSLFVLVIVGGLHYFWNRNIGDDLSRRSVFIKIISSVMIILGIYLIQ